MAEKWLRKLFLLIQISIMPITFFKNHGIIAELKCLTEDKLSDPIFMAKVSNCLAKWGLAGQRLEELDSGCVHKECFAELREIYAEPLRRVIKTANRQIRETKKSLNLHDYKGLLLLANDGNYALPPRTLLLLVYEILKGSYRELNDFVLFTVNVEAQVPMTNVPSYIWISGCISPKRAIPAAILENIGHKWKEHHESVCGKIFQTFGGNGNNYIYPSKSTLLKMRQ